MPSLRIVDSIDIFKYSYFCLTSSFPSVPPYQFSLVGLKEYFHIVGHTLQWSVKKLFKGKVFAIDVKHPKDYNANFPPRSS